MTLFASLKSLIFPTPALTPGQSAAPVEMNTTADFAAILTMADDAAATGGPVGMPAGLPADADVDLCDYAPLPTGDGEQAIAPNSTAISPRAILDGMQARSAIRVDAAKLPAVASDVPVEAVLLKEGSPAAMRAKPDAAVDPSRLLDADDAKQDPAVDPVRLLPVDPAAVRVVVTEAVEPDAQLAAVSPETDAAQAKAVTVERQDAPVAVTVDRADAVAEVQSQVVEPKPERGIDVAPSLEKPVIAQFVDPATPAEPTSPTEPVEAEKADAQKADDATMDAAVAPERPVVVEAAPVLMTPIIPALASVPMVDGDDEAVSISGVGSMTGVSGAKAAPTQPLAMGAVGDKQPVAGSPYRPLPADGDKPADETALSVDPLPQPFDGLPQAGKPVVDAVREGRAHGASDAIAPVVVEAQLAQSAVADATMPLAANVLRDVVPPVDAVAPSKLIEPVPTLDAAAKPAIPATPALVVELAVDLSQPVVAKADPAAPLAPVQPDARVQQIAPLATPVDPAPLPVAAVPQAAAPAAVSPDKPAEPVVASLDPVVAEPSAPKSTAPRSEALALLQIVRDHMATRRAGQAVAADPAVQAARPVKATASTASVEPTAALVTPVVATTQPVAVAPAPQVPASQVDVAAAITRQLVDATASGQWIDGLSQDIARLAASGDQGRFRVNTAGLGSVDVDIRPDLGGGAAISLTVASEAAELALRQDSEQLRTEPALSHLRISEVRVDRVAVAQDMARTDQDTQQRGGSSGQSQSQASLMQSNQGQHQQNRLSAQENMSLAHKAAAEQAVIRRGQADDATLARARRAASGERYA